MAANQLCARPGAEALRALLLLYPVTDHPSAGHPSYTENATGYGLEAGVMRWFWEQYAAGVSPADPAISPLRLAELPALPPTLVATAEYDVLRDEGLAYAAKLGAAGVPLTHLHGPDMQHNFPVTPATVGRFPQCRDTLAGIAAWLRATLPWLCRARPIGQRARAQCKVPSLLSPADGSMLLALFLIAAPLCNGRAELCARPYNKVTFAATHDSYAASEYVPNVLCLVPLYCPITNIGFVDQQHGITQQLKDGIRVFDLRLLPDTGGGTSLCHARHDKCQLQADFIKAFVKSPKAALDEASMAFSTPDAVFNEYRVWIEAHPTEVLAIEIALLGGTPPAYLRGLLDRHKLTQYVHHHVQGQAWDTLGKMIADKKRLVIYADGGTAADGWQNSNVLTSGGLIGPIGSGWSGKWSSKDIVNDCHDPLPNPLPVDAVLDFTHHLTMASISVPQLDVNTTSLEQHLYNCYQRHKQNPTYVFVDKYAGSWVFDVVAEANGGTIHPPHGVLREVTDSSKCGFEHLIDKTKCGSHKVEDGVQCGYHKLVAKLKHQQPVTCEVPKSCNVPRTCKLRVAN